jgi:hypothetical protein
VTTIRSRQAAFVEPLPERMRHRRRCKLAASSAAASSFVAKSALSAFSPIPSRRRSAPGRNGSWRPASASTAR